MAERLAELAFAEVFDGMIRHDGSVFCAQGMPRLRDVVCGPALASLKLGEAITIIHLAMTLPFERACPPDRGYRANALVLARVFDQQ